MRQKSEARVQKLEAALVKASKMQRAEAARVEDLEATLESIGTDSAALNRIRELEEQVSSRNRPPVKSGPTFVMIFGEFWRTTAPSVTLKMFQIQNFGPGFTVDQFHDPLSSWLMLIVKWTKRKTTSRSSRVSTVAGGPMWPTSWPSSSR